MSIEAESLKQYLADHPPSVVQLAIKPHFEALSDTEKLYAHYISKASLAGTRIVLKQVSPESPDIYDFIVSLHKQFKGDWKTIQQKAGISDGELQDFLNYAAQFLGNCGNYKSFGDSKFIPRIAPEKLEAIASVSQESKSLWEKFKNNIYENKTLGLMHLGYPEDGHLSTYYPDSPDITTAEITAVSKFLEGKPLLPENTRIRKNGDTFEVLIASAQTDPKSEDRDLTESEWTLDGELAGKKVVLKYGDYSQEMTTISEAIEGAIEHAANQTQKLMLEAYSKSFRAGSMNAYLESQRQWIKDKVSG
jgi:dipeptidyl-peptidase-3